MANGSIQIYTSAGQAAPLAGVALTVLDENGAALAHLTADADGFAEAADLPAPDAAYSLDEANSAVRPYAIYSVEAVLDGWQTVVLNGVQVFDGQQTVARLSLLPNGGIPSAARTAGGETDPDVVTIPPHTLFAGGTLTRRRPGPGRRAEKNHGASGETIRQRQKCDGQFSVLHRQRRVQ